MVLPFAIILNVEGQLCTATIIPFCFNTAYYVVYEISHVNVMSQVALTGAATIIG